MALHFPFYDRTAVKNQGFEPGWIGTEEEIAENDYSWETVLPLMCLMENDEWMITIKDHIQRMDTAENQHWQNHSIYKVPVSAKDFNTKAYRPQLVSFGPYHYGEYQLGPMEEHKHRALLHFLKKSSKPLESHLESLAKVAQSLKDSYESLDPVWQVTDEFLRMMLVDGSFMIEVMRYTTTTNDYASNDLVFSNHGMLHIVPYIRQDMLMLENQIPMLLLTTLLDEETKQEQDKEFVNKLICNFLGFLHEDHDISVGDCLHLLDVHRKILLWPDSPTSSSHTKIYWHWIVSSITDYNAGDEIIQSAVKMKEAGISFKKSKSKSLHDISFARGELRLPTIIVDDTTESMFLNHIAFERFHVGAGNAVTSYLYFMDNIVVTAEDVSLLRDKGIIQNALYSDKAVSQLFHSITRYTTLDPDSNPNAVLGMVDKYCKHPLSKWRAYACRNYYATFSAAAAFVIFILSMLQTVYSILSYYQHKS